MDREGPVVRGSPCRAGFPGGPMAVCWKEGYKIK